MKTLIPLMLVTAVGCAAHAQPQTATPVPPPPPPLEEDVVIVAQAPKPAPAPKAAPAAGIAALPPDEPNNININKGPHGAGITWSTPVPYIKYGLGGTSAGSRRTIIIPKGDPNPEVLNEAEEDLNVMTVILEKALEQRSDDERRAMGIDIFSGSSGIRNLLIEGHGAIFVLKTKIAFLPPPSPKKEDAKNKETTSSEWEDAKRQIYGSSELQKEIDKAMKHAQNSFSSGEEYDAEKLQRLKDSLIEALKSASNIRHLSGDNTVTIVVLSSSSVADVRKIVTGLSGTRGDKRTAEVYARADRETVTYDGRSGSRMMLQVKKSDIDAYAKGKLTTDAFRDKVKIQVY